MSFPAVISRIARLVSLVAALALASQAQAQSELFGRVLEQVTCEADAAQSYALYIPSNYAREKKWPVIFCFDPGARGKIPVERLQAAAEKYGYVVAGSLNSRNGPYDANVRAIQAMVKDVSSHFSIDPRRIYAAGMSGGARVATSLGLSGFAKGVIACSAGFPAPTDVPAQVPFALFGTAGAEDFNYQEMMRLDGELEERKATHRIVIFDGTHEWASAELLTEAVEWLELQAMRAGTRAKDDAFVETLLHNRANAVPTQPALATWRALKSIAADFAGFADTSDYEQKAKQLAGSREIKDGLKAERVLTTRENSLLAEVGGTALESASERQRLAATLRQKAEADEDSAERRMVRRVIAGFSSMTRETVRGMFETHDYDQAVAMMEMAVALRPEQPRNWFDLARARAFNGDKKRALESLRRAASAGFTDAARAESDPAFAKIRNDTGFQEILTRMRDVSESDLVQLPEMKISAVFASVELRPFYLPNPGTDVLPLSFLRVESVRPGSAAARAGLKENMEVTAIQGVRIRGMTAGELDALLARPAKREIVLAVRERSSDAERELHIALASLSPTPAGAAANK